METQIEQPPYLKPSESEFAYPLNFLPETHSYSELLNFSEYFLKRWPNADILQFGISYSDGTSGLYMVNVDYAIEQALKGL